MPKRVGKKSSFAKEERGFGAGNGVEIVENGVRRVKRNIFSDVLHQLFGVATD